VFHHDWQTGVSDLITMIGLMGMLNQLRDFSLYTNENLTGITKCSKIFYRNNIKPATCLPSPTLLDVVIINQD